MKMRIGGSIYDFASPTELSLRDLIKLEKATTELGMPVNLGIIEERQAEIDAIEAPTKAERMALLGRQPWAQMMFAVNIFTARRKAGDDVTFDDCLDMSPADVDFIIEAGDQEPDPTVRPPRQRASAAAVKRPADRAAKTSKPASTPASS